MNQDNVVPNMQNKINSASYQQGSVHEPICQATRPVAWRLVRPVLLASTLGLTVLATGCALTDVEEESAPIVTTTAMAQTPDLPEGSVRYDTNDARVAELWSSAEQARLEANSDLALQHLFEALEISPQNSLLWSRAAEIQLNNQQAALAETLALKSNTFAGNNDSLLHRNWLIIEHARSMRGDLLGVRSAHKKVQEFKYR